MTTEPVMVEQISDGFDEDLGSYKQIWMCEPPRAGKLFIVTRDEWNEDLTERRVYSWRPAE